MHEISKRKHYLPNHGRSIKKIPFSVGTAPVLSRILSLFLTKHDVSKWSLQTRAPTLGIQSGERPQKLIHCCLVYGFVGKWCRSLLLLHELTMQTGISEKKIMF